MDLTVNELKDRFITSLVNFEQAVQQARELATKVRWSINLGTPPIVTVSITLRKLTQLCSNHRISRLDLQSQRRLYLSCFGHDPQVNAVLLLLLLLAWLLQTVIGNLDVPLPLQQIVSQQDHLDGAFRCYLEGGLL
jgi:hypothetical protein